MKNKKLIIGIGNYGRKIAKIIKSKKLDNFYSLYPCYNLLFNEINSNSYLIVNSDVSIVTATGVRVDRHESVLKAIDLICSLNPNADIYAISPFQFEGKKKKCVSELFIKKIFEKNIYATVIPNDLIFDITLNTDTLSYSFKRFDNYVISRMTSMPMAA